jgi:hypothetical protein
MAAKGKGDRKQIIIRMSDSDISCLREVQKQLGELSQSDTFKVLLRLYLKKISAFPALKGS